MVEIWSVCSGPPMRTWRRAGKVSSFPPRDASCLSPFSSFFSSLVEITLMFWFLVLVLLGVFILSFPWWNDIVLPPDQTEPTPCTDPDPTSRLPPAGSPPSLPASAHSRATLPVTDLSREHSAANIGIHTTSYPLGLATSHTVSASLHTFSLLAVVVVIMVKLTDRSSKDTRFVQADKISCPSTPSSRPPSPSPPLPKQIKRQHPPMASATFYLLLLNLILLAHGAAVLAGGGLHTEKIMSCCCCCCQRGQAKEPITSQFFPWTPLCVGEGEKTKSD